MIRKNDFLEMEGEGKPILVMHGGIPIAMKNSAITTCIKTVFRPLLLRGPAMDGRLKMPGNLWTSHAIIMQHCLIHLKIEKVHLLAMSAGGPSGIYFASKYPDRVESLVLQSAVIKTWLTTKDAEYRIGRILFRQPVEKAVWQLVSSCNNRFPKWMFKHMMSSSAACRPGARQNERERY